jgi:polar amino acid transport system substrate-binding protein
LRSDSADGPFDQFVSEKLEAYAALKPALLKDREKLPGSKILPGNFMTVQQAIGTDKKNAAGAAFLRDFVAEAKKSGLVAQLIEKHRVQGLSVAP